MNLCIVKTKTLMGRFWRCPIVKMWIANPKVDTLSYTLVRTTINYRMACPTQCLDENRYSEAEGSGTELY
jgi:hypothetical protein